MSSEQGLALMKDWIVRHPGFSGVGWHPYPVSLRLVNWIYFVASNFKDTALEQQYVDSIALQAAWLKENIEHHILANHLFENAKALLFAGAFLDGALGDECVTTGLEILRAELDEQFLDDGGHYERTPMYHAILTLGLVDLSNLFSSNPGTFSADDLYVVNVRARAALNFLDELDPPDHSMPFFNDSTDGIAPERVHLAGFAQRIFDFHHQPKGEELRFAALDSSGYYVIREPGNFLMIDCGDVGPDYQPGHAHCDTLSYEYFGGGQKLITNCGNFDYVQSAERRYARSTAAHNTVVIDGAEQSEIWGAFRVARRARPIDPKLVAVGDSQVKFTGAHDGYQRLPSGLIHRREINYFSGGRFRVDDTIEGRGSHSAESFVHFVSGLNVRQTGEVFEVSNVSGQQILKVSSPDADTVEILSTERYPEFGLKETGISLRFRKRGEAPFHFCYEVELCAA